MLYQYEIQLLPALLVIIRTMFMTIGELIVMGNVGNISTEQPRDRGLIIAVIYIIIISVITLLCLLPLYIVRSSANIPNSVKKTFPILT